MGLVTEKKIGVLMGGLSAEREVSLKSGDAILKALKDMGYNAAGIDVGRDLADGLKQEKIEFAFIALHGRYGEDGAVQGMLEIMGIPYTGSGIAASALGMNKVFSKKIFEFHKLPVGQYMILEKKDLKDWKGKDSSLEFPVVVKPVSEGSSVGVSIVSEEKGLKDAFALAFKYGKEILIEKYIKGREIQVGILGKRPLGAIEIIPKRQFYDYEAKYTANMSEHIFPARLPEQVYNEALELGLKAHSVLGCKGYSRVDLIIDSDNRPFLLEVNTLPGMTNVSLLPEIAKGVGIDFNRLVEMILMEALKEDN
ncbi:MAG: D-alanine--D-alanine ligase [Nitrospirota bacterium]